MSEHPEPDAFPVFVPAWRRPSALAVVGACLAAFLLARTETRYILAGPLLVALWFALLRTSQLPTTHAVLGAVVFGESLWLASGALVLGPGLLVTLAFDIAVPSVLLASYLLARFALARSAFLALWMLILYEAVALHANVIVAMADPVTAVFIRIANHFIALAALGLIAVGRGGGPGVAADVFD